MRLIDANALIAEMHNVILEDGEDRRTFYEVIERQPTIIAQPEIIRCQNCQYWEREKPFATSGRCFIWECANRKGSDYCSEARKVSE